MDADLKDRAQWYDQAVKNRTERFKRTSAVKPMNEKTPNLVDREVGGQRSERNRSPMGGEADAASPRAGGRASPRAADGENETDTLNNE